MILEYQNPVSGGPTMPTLATTLQTLRPGFHGVARRTTGSRVYVGVRGHGTMIVDGQRFDWGAGDFIAIKPWAWVEHVNPHDQNAQLFQVNDSPVLDALGYFRSEAMTANCGHQVIESTTSPAQDPSA